MQDAEYIEYRGGKISPTKAKGLLVLLKTGVYNPKLSEEESGEYSVWKEHYENMNKGGRRNISFPINKRGYLIWQLQNYFNLGEIIKSAETGIDSCVRNLPLPRIYKFLKISTF
jgi:hypothetical protein